MSSSCRTGALCLVHQLIENPPVCLSGIKGGRRLIWAFLWLAPGRCPLQPLPHLGKGQPDDESGIPLKSEDEGVGDPVEVTADAWVKKPNSASRNTRALRKSLLL